MSKVSEPRNEVRPPDSRAESQAGLNGLGGSPPLGSDRGLGTTLPMPPPCTAGIRVPLARYGGLFKDFHRVGFIDVPGVLPVEPTESCP